MRQACVILALACFSACGSSAPTGPTGTPRAILVPLRGLRVLMVTATAGFRHDSIATARQTMSEFARTQQFSVDATEDLTSLSVESLNNFDVVMFALTSGELPLNQSQRSALIAAINGGKGFIGIHSAADTLYEFPDYGRLVGAYFKEHPWTQTARVLVEDDLHPASGVNFAFTLEEEFYTFRENPRGRVTVLLRLDAESVNATGDYPLAWAQSFGSGRSYYNALGHFPATWRDNRFLTQLAAALQWVSRR